MSRDSERIGLATYLVVLELLVLIVLLGAAVIVAVRTSSQIASQARDIAQGNRRIIRSLENTAMIQSDQQVQLSRCIASLLVDLARQAHLHVKGVEPDISSCRALAAQTPAPPKAGTPGGSGSGGGGPSPSGGSPRPSPTVSLPIPPLPSLCIPPPQDQCAPHCPCLFPKGGRSE